MQRVLIPLAFLAAAGLLSAQPVTEQCADGRVMAVSPFNPRPCETHERSKLADTLEEQVEVAALTRSAEGSVVLANGERFDVPATPVERVVDATGAGDLFASGFIFGLSLGASLERCAELGSIAAGEVITHMGPRPHVQLSTLI